MQKQIKCGKQKENATQGARKKKKNVLWPHSLCALKDKTRVAQHRRGERGEGQSGLVFVSVLKDNLKGCRSCTHP